MHGANRYLFYFYLASARLLRTPNSSTKYGCSLELGSGCWVRQLSLSNPLDSYYCKHSRGRGSNALQKQPLALQAHVDCGDVKLRALYTIPLSLET